MKTPTKSIAAYAMTLVVLLSSSPVIYGVCGSYQKSKPLMNLGPGSTYDDTSGCQAGCLGGSPSCKQVQYNPLTSPPFRYCTGAPYQYQGCETVDVTFWAYTYKECACQAFGGCTCVNCGPNISVDQTKKSAQDCKP